MLDRAGRAVATTSCRIAHEICCCSCPTCLGPISHPYSPSSSAKETSYGIPRPLAALLLPKLAFHSPFLTVAAQGPMGLQGQDCVRKEVR